MVGTHRYKLLILSIPHVMSMRGLNTPHVQTALLGKEPGRSSVGSREPWEVPGGGPVEVTQSRLAFRKGVLVAVVQNWQPRQDWRRGGCGGMDAVLVWSVFMPPHIYSLLRIREGPDFKGFSWQSCDTWQPRVGCFWMRKLRLRVLTSPA